MNLFVKNISILFLLILCGWSHNKPKLVVGTAADYPPFTFTQGKQVVGFDIDLARAIAKKLGYRLHIKDMNFSELIPSLQHKKIDIAIAAITATSQRAQIVDFSTVRYYLPKFALIYLKDRPVTSLKALENKVVAVQSSSTMEDFLKQRLNLIENAKVISFERTLSIIEDLKEGLIDSVLIELTEAKVFCSENESFNYSLLTTFDTFNYAVAFPKRSKLISQINDVMIQFKISNEFEQLKKKWLKYNMILDQ